MADDFYDKLNTEAAKLETNEAYENFVDKFKPKLTTDDCFTPPEIYEVVKTWAIEEYDWQDREIVRPFYPNGDYINETYPENCVVIDNPPFSIISEIARFYEAQHIDYFLFAPSLTVLAIRAARSHLCVGGTITYSNGAAVNTSFVCSQGAMIRSAPSLRYAIDKTNEELQKAKKPQLPRYEYPPELLTATAVNYMSRYGVDYQENYTYRVGELDAQKAYNKAIYGSGYLVPREAAERAEREAAERAEREAAERREKTLYWQLSEREEEIVRELERQKEIGGMEYSHAVHTSVPERPKPQIEYQLNIFNIGRKET